VVLASRITRIGGIYGLPKIDRCTVKIGKARSHDSHDGAKNSGGAEREGFAEYIRVAIEMRLPEGIAEDDGLRQLLHFIGGENSAEDGFLAEKIEIVWSDVLYAYSFGTMNAGEGSGFRAAGESNVVEDVILRFPIEKFSDGRRLIVVGVAEWRFPDGD